MVGMNKQKAATSKARQDTKPSISSEVIVVALLRKGSPSEMDLTGEGNKFLIQVLGEAPDGSNWSTLGIAYVEKHAVDYAESLAFAGHPTVRVTRKAVDK